MKATGFAQLEPGKSIFYHIDKDTEKKVLVGCEVDDLIITGNGASCTARLKKQLQDDCKVKDWERIASFIGLNIFYDLTSAILAMDIRSKIERLLEDHSILNILKNVKVASQLGACFYACWLWSSVTPSDGTQKQIPYTSMCA